MTTVNRHMGLISGKQRRTETALLAFAMLLVVTMCAMQTAQAQSYTVLYSFTGGLDGLLPEGGLTLDAAGNLYGTTPVGGAYLYGTVFRLDSNGRLTVLHNFSGQDAIYPNAPLIRDAEGNLYGTTASARGADLYGTVFRLDTNGTFTILHNFVSADGEQPGGGLIRDAAGNLYGTTSYGGYHFGTVFKLDPRGTFTVLHIFNDWDGSNPFGALLRDGAGNLYGTTYGGDPHGVGVAVGEVFKLDKVGTLTVLHSFDQQEEGKNPLVGLKHDAAGNFFGTTYEGGDLTCNAPYGCGTVFQLDAHGLLTVLHTFTTADGINPGSLCRDTAGNLYGTTFLGGAYGFGTLFELHPTTRRFKVMHNFGNGIDGRSPLTGLIRDSAGNLYGTTNEGGASHRGTIFRVSRR